MAKSKRATHALSKALYDCHNQHGYDATIYFRWLVDDVLAGFGIKMSDIPPEETRPIIFELAGLYAGEVINNEPFYDVLGNTYMELVSVWGQKALGQYFTPWPVALMMAQMNYQEYVTGKKSISVCDPACGSGVMLLSFAHYILKEKGKDALARYSFTGIDLDRFCARIFPCQMLSNIFVHQVPVSELLVYQGNALGDFDKLDVIVHATNPNTPKTDYIPAKSEHRAAALKTIRSGQEKKGSQLALF